MTDRGGAPPGAPAGALPDALSDALVAATLCAADPRGLGGMVLRGGGDARDAVLAAFRDASPAGAPWRRLPAAIDDDQLLGGLDLAATLSEGRSVRRAGLLDAARGGALVVPMAERLSDATSARIAAALDDPTVPAPLALLLLDDGLDPEERPPVALRDRIAFHLDLGGVRPADAPRAPAAGAAVAAALREEAMLAALVETAAALGIGSARAVRFALRAARGIAAMAGRGAVAAEDLVLAARLVLAPRATRLPPAAEPAPEAAPEPPPADAEGERERQSGETLGDVVLAATRASLPADLLAAIAAGGGRAKAASAARGAGERRRSARHGRPRGVRPGLPRGGARLSLIDTLRAATPWQRLRRRDEDEDEGGGDRIRLRRDDLRVRRFETRAEATTIFAVDASGSSALARLAEAKGAVELLLAEAYVKRAQVALIAFRGRSAELLLPPTRSLSRARRALAELPGGGGTPLATGLDAARACAEAARARGRTPFVVVLTDGRANIAADGSTARPAAERDAHAAARAIGAAGLAAAFIDISPYPRAEGGRLAAAMGARYLALPRADAAAMHAAIRAAQPPAARR